jgi:Tfp pilus assembly protein FimT
VRRNRDRRQSCFKLGDEGGFTLLEVAFTLLLLALLFSLAQSAAGSLAEVVRLRGEAENLAWVLRSARQRAVSQNQPQTVRFYREERAYHYADGGGPAEHTLAEGITFIGTSDPPAFTFNPSGAPSLGGHVGLQSERRRMYVIVNPAAGRVRVSAQPPS